MKHFTADRHSQLNSQFLNLTLQIIWCLFLRGAILLLRQNYKSNYRVLIQYSKGRQPFSSQTTILRNIISLVKLLKGKKDRVFMVCPSCLQLFPSCEQSKIQEPIPVLCRSILTRRVQTPTLSLRKLRRNPCTKNT